MGILVAKNFYKDYIKLNLQQLFTFNFHLGHNKNSWNVNLNSYTYGIRENYLIINLDFTFFLYKRSLNFLITLISKGGFLLIIHNNMVNNHRLFFLFYGLNEYFFYNNWLNGFLTGFKTVSKYYLPFMMKKKCLLKENKKLYKRFFGVKSLYSLPFCIFSTQNIKNKFAVTEAALLGIPSIGLIDTNYSYQKVLYGIPGNDDTILGELFNYILIRNAIILGYYLKYRKIFSFLIVFNKKMLNKYGIVQKFLLKKKFKICKNLQKKYLILKLI